MIKKAQIFTALIFVLCGMTKAKAINITTITDKESYLLAEEVVVSVTAYNPDLNPVTLYFATSLEASYLMDGVYDWSEDKLFSQVPTSVTIDPYGYYTWQLTHGPTEMEAYPLEIGAHTVVGEVVGYGNSSTVQFQVIPEPAAMLLLTLGGLLLTSRRR
jgi:hypothetical protein